MSSCFGLVCLYIENRFDFPNEVWVWFLWPPKEAIIIKLDHGLCRGGRRGGRFGRKRGSDSPGGRWNKAQKVEA